MRSLNLTGANTADIRGEKTRTRPMRPDEAALVYPWTLDPDVNRFWGAGEHYDDVDDFLRRACDEPHYFDGSCPEDGRCFAIEADGKLIGMINYNEIHPTHLRTSIDVVVGHPDYRNRGYGADALRAFLAFLFDEIGLHRVWLTMIDYNDRARRVYERLGFKQEGVLRESQCVGRQVVRRRPVRDSRNRIRSF